MRLLFFRSRTLASIIKYLTVIFITIALFLCYNAYRKYNDWWKRERNYVTMLEEFNKKQTTKARVFLTKLYGVIDLHKPLIVINEKQTEKEVEENFFRYLEQKDVKCMDSTRLGGQHDGGYNVCLSPPFGLSQPCNVFSFGIKGDWSFVESVAELYKCTVYAYDNNEKSTQQDQNLLIHFKKSGLGVSDGYTPSGTIKTLATYLQETGHTNTSISYVNIDIEHQEWKVLRQIVRDSSLRRVKQIGFEVHTKELLKKTTTKKDYVRMYRILRGLEKFGFRRYDHRNNPFGSFTSKVTNVRRSCCYELYYVNMNFVDGNTRWTSSSSRNGR